MEIRRLDISELPQAIELVRLTYMACIQPNINSKEQEGFFYEYIAEENLRKSMEQEELFLWGVVEGNLLLAVSAMTHLGQITMLYVHPDFQRRGFGHDLLLKMRKFADTERKLPTVCVNASPAWTWKYFKKNHFELIDRRQPINGPYVGMQADSIPIRDYKERKLSEGTILKTTLLFLAAILLSSGAYLAFYFR